MVRAFLRSSSWHMNMTEMNVRDIKYSVSLTFLCGFGAVVLGGCAFNPSTDADSPLGPRIQALVEAHPDYPRLADFPPPPRGMPSREQVRERVAGLQQADAVLGSQLAAIDWQLTGNAEEVAAALRLRMAEFDVAAPTATTASEIEAYAEALRARAKAPPPIDRLLR